MITGSGSRHFSWGKLETNRTGLESYSAMQTLVRTLSVLVVLSSSLCVFSQQAPEKPKPEAAKPPASDVLPPADTPAAPVDPKSYKIGPEDVIMIRVWHEPELSGQFIVRPDGKITLPLAGELNVQDQSPEQVQAKVLELYSKYVNKPEVSVSLSRIGSKKYYLVGMFMKSGTYPLVVPTTVLEAINGAGGFQEFANRKKVTILRGNKILNFNWEEVMKGKKLEQNILLENGDHIQAR